MSDRTFLPDRGARLTILCGPYGTGKSECAVALARRTAPPVTLIDLDVVNPYFRSREARSVLEAHDVEVIGNSLGIDAGIDLPAIPGVVAPRLRDTDRRVIVDLGGDPAGARAIRQFRAHIPTEDTDVLYVANPYRTANGDVEATIASIGAIEGEIGVRCTGLINNAHLLSETTCEHLLRGDRLCREVGDRIGLPVVYVAARGSVFEDCRARGAAPAGVALELFGALRQNWMDQGR